MTTTLRRAGLCALLVSAPLLAAVAAGQALPSPLEGEGGSRSEPGEGRSWFPSPPAPLPQGARGENAAPMLAQPKRPAGKSGVYRDKVTPHWFAGETKFWYRNDLKGGTREFVLVDAEKGTRGPAFDHAKLAAGLSKATGNNYTADRLPFDAIAFAAGEKAVTFTAGDQAWTCDLTTYACEKSGKGGPLAPRADADDTARGASGPPSGDDPLFDDPMLDPREGAEAAQPPGKKDDRQAKSADGKWTAAVKDNNVVLTDADGKETVLTKNGIEGAGYGMLAFSPDSKGLVAFRIEPGDRKEVHLLESSPKAGGRATLQSRPYPLPGDKFTSYEPHVFDVAGQKELQTTAEKVDFGTPRIRWNKDGHTFTYQKVDRGHQRFRLMAIDTHTGAAGPLIDEKTDTFIWTAHTESLGVPPVTWLTKTDEIVYASEMSGWRHLYLADVPTGRVKHPITAGEFVVRGVDKIDEEKRQVWFRACGKNPDQDPYFIHYYRVNFDGTGLTALTDGNGTHTVQYSPGQKYLVDTYSRVDQAPITELRRADDGKRVCPLEEADISELKAAGWTPPEVFVAKGRDGKTDIWGFIVRPKGFDPAKKYPVIEAIYAGPHGSHVPKVFSPIVRHTALTDLGFVVVQVDGMGTANRSKAFHDVCWKNLKDAGFPDRVLWHKAIAAKYPWYDISRVGIYGTSAGGQNAMGALLFHGDFYKAAMAACGCHDNRMDKASWNEQWMGYPVGPQYAASSNVDNAKNLTGKLLLIVGEMDTNVPPESTMRVVDALVKANKDFDLLVVPGMGHSNGGAYGTRRMQDFFVRHLQGKEPPDRNNPAARKGEEPEEPIAVQPPPKKDEPQKKDDTAKKDDPPKKAEPIDVAALVAKPKSEAAVVARRYDSDRGNLTRAYAVPLSPTRVARLTKFHTDWLRALKAVDAEALSPAAREELVALRSRVESDLKELESRAATDAAVLPLVPFAETIIALEETRRRMEPLDAQRAAGQVDALKRQIDKLKTTIEAGITAGEFGPGLPATKPVTTRGADAADALRGALRAWHGFYVGYDPLFTWWLAEPYKQADAAIDGYVKFLREKAKELPDGEKFAPKFVPVIPWAGPSDAPDLVALMAAPASEFAPVLTRFRGGAGGRPGGGGGAGGGGPRPDQDPARWLDGLKAVPFDTLSPSARADYLLFKNHLEHQLKTQELRTKKVDRPMPPKDDTGITGRPIGREALLADLAGEMIPYSPEELIALAREEMAWCDAEMLKASREMGFGDDWKKAVEKVKAMHVPPGAQPKLIRELAVEAVDFLKAGDLITVPPLAAETWRMTMMSPERQLTSPFFLGGETIIVSFPTNTMAHDAKLQSMRGNNIPFARATVHHELIPGHGLQAFMNPRYHPQRGLFGTPFWGEGWALYWEFVLYAKGLPKTPEDRVGFLTWRKHRCARVMFSLGYHLGTMTPRQCVDLLIDRVGFEPDNSMAEVRRSFGGGYGPLYQCAYLLGGMQFRALRKELVDSGKMTDREFHDAVLAEHSMPVAMVRAILTKQPLTADGLPPWKFGGSPVLKP